MCTVAFTGHRPSKLWNDYDLKTGRMQMLKADIIAHLNLIKAQCIISGMALGIDTLAALIAIENDIPLTCAIPFKGQESIWPTESQDTYNKILAYPKASIEIISPGGYTSAKMQVRNQWMVHHCDILIGVWDGTPGGTANCVGYAMHYKDMHNYNLEIHIINPQNYKM